MTRTGPRCNSFAHSGQRPEGMEENCIGSQDPQRTAALDLLSSFSPDSEIQNVLFQNSFFPDKQFLQSRHLLRWCWKFVGQVLTDTSLLFTLDTL
jgi:hypothetical protein